MIAFKDILLDRLQNAQKNPEELALFYKNQSKEHNKKWNFGVQCFQKRINKDRAKEGGKPVTFMAVRNKLLALYEINDLRWFYMHCLKFSYTKDLQGKRNTFSRGFFGLLKVK